VYFFTPLKFMHGLHLIADLTGCPTSLALMTSAEALRATCLAAVQSVGLHAVAERFHSFADLPEGAQPIAGVDQQAGVTGVVLLAESHATVHTWPELGAVTLDVYVCNRGADNSARAHGLMQSLIDAFEPQQVRQQGVMRGDLDAA
jgi:S-adenosylmethionine decarboxylase